MAIPSDVLIKWAAVGKSENSKITYAALRKVIEDRYGSNVEMFLQGSYHNSTHVKENSDIDIVVINKNIVVNNTLYGMHGQQALYSWKDELYKEIQGAQNFVFKKGAKTIKYSGNTNYVPADIVPCAYYKNAQIGGAVGTILYDSTLDRFFVNYPKQHYDNGTIKSENTNGNYKKTVRMFKNARNEAVKKGLIAAEEVAPSYFLECLLYNVPNSKYLGNESDVFFNVLKCLWDNKSRLETIKCQNGVQKLFGYDLLNKITYNKWNVNDAIKFINALANLWNNWGE